MALKHKISGKTRESLKVGDALEKRLRQGSFAEQENQSLLILRDNLPPQGNDIYNEVKDRAPSLRRLDINLFASEKDLRDASKKSGSKAEFIAALKVIVSTGSTVYPAHSSTISRFARQMEAVALTEGKEPWVPPPPGRSKKDEARENPAAFIARVYEAEIKDGRLTRDLLGQIHEKLPQAYAQWISPKRHPEDSLWPETDGKMREARDALSRLSPADHLDHIRRTNVASQARIRKRHKDELTKT